MFHSKEIAKLQTRISELETELAAANAQASSVEQLQTDLATAQTGLTEATASLDAERTAHATTTTNLTAAQTRITELEGQATAAAADLEARISAEVINRCAAAGLDAPIARDPKADHPGPGSTAPNPLKGRARLASAIAAQFDSPAKQ